MTFLILCCRVGTRVQQCGGDGGGFVIPGRPMQGGRAGFVPRVWIGPGVQQCGDDSRVVIVPGRLMQGRCAEEFIPRLGVGTRVQ